MCIEPVEDHMLADLPTDVLEKGIVARILAYPSDRYLLALLDFDPSSCFETLTARRVYSACLQNISTSRTEPVLNPAEVLNLSESDLSALDYLHRAIDGGCPYGVADLVRCCLELRERNRDRRLEEQANEANEAWLLATIDDLEDADDVEW